MFFFTEGDFYADIPADLEEVSYGKQPRCGVGEPERAPPLPRRLANRKTTRAGKTAAASDA
jgi:hypothetical protein